MIVERSLATGARSNNHARERVLNLFMTWTESGAARLVLFIAEGYQFKFVISFNSLFVRYLLTIEAFRAMDTPLTTIII